jgi:folate-binding protein YgfZ
MSESATLTTEAISTPTPLALQLQISIPVLELQLHAGVFTPRAFSSQPQELRAATSAAAIFDLGYRTRIRVTGPDRLRWLNGMVSNAIQALPEHYGNYNFILNAQGRIQGDAYIYRRANDLLLDTDRSQAPRLVAHLDHFIIMDDVELQPLDDATTGIGLIGPRAAALLDSLGVQASHLAPLQLAETSIAGRPVTLIRAYSVLWPRFELWFAPEDALAIWSALASAGAEPIGCDAVEALRILEGIPAYGTDITDRSLAQETAQTRALNFTKGCYLGQEIVERIRSRATVHRTLRQFSLDGELPPVPAELSITTDAAAPIVVGQLTSAADIDLPGYRGKVAIGTVRTEAIERKARISYTGGTVAVLGDPPLSSSQ